MGWVLDKLWKATLNANPQKCHMGLTEVQYMEYSIGHGLLNSQEWKVDAVHRYPQPETKKQVHAFMGLASYYRKVVLNFASPAAHLSDKSRKEESE